MLRQLKNENKLAGIKLFYANKTDKDIILKEELDAMLKDNATYVITDQDSTDYTKAYIDKDFLKKNVENFDEKFYVCGPPKMTEEVGGILKDLGANPDAVTLDDQ